MSINFYKKLKDDNNKQYYNPNDNIDIKHPAKISICAKSGAGKTNFLINILAEMGNIEMFYIMAKQPDEKLYKYLQDQIAGVDKDRIILSDKIEDLPELDKIDSSLQTAIIFDDFITDKKAMPKIGEYWIRGRKRNCTMIFISQSWFEIPKILRVNTDWVFIRNIKNKRDNSMIITDFQMDISVEDMKKIYNQINKIPMSFMGINSKGEIYHNFKKIL